MKIVHIITRLIVGGAQENTLITCEELVRRGHEVTLITGPAIGPEGGLFEVASKMGFKVIVVEKLVRAIKPLNDLLAYIEIKKLLKKIEPDIVHTHSAKAGILGRYAGWSIKDKSKKPFVVHGVHGLSFHPYQNHLLNWLYVSIEKAASRKTDAFIGVADTMRDKSLAVGIGREGMYTTAYSAIGERGFWEEPAEGKIVEFKQKYNIDDESVVLIKVARLFDLKGHEYVIESAKQLVMEFPECVWVFVGDGIRTEELRHKIKEAGLENYFRFTGLLKPDEVSTAIYASDILVHCSLREGLARVLPQAMLCKKPVVSFDIDGAWEVVNDRTGRLVKPCDVETFTNACEELILDEGLRRRLGEAGYEMVKKMYAPKTMVDVIEKVYYNLIDK